MIWTKQFWQATIERVVASIAGGALSAIGADAFGVINADWVGIGSIALGAGVVSLLKAVAAQGVTGDGPSLTHAETLDGKRGYLDQDAGFNN